MLSPISDTAYRWDDADLDKQVSHISRVGLGGDGPHLTRLLRQVEHPLDLTATLAIVYTASFASRDIRLEEHGRFVEGSMMDLALWLGVWVLTDREKRYTGTKFNAVGEVGRLSECLVTQPPTAAWLCAKLYATNCAQATKLRLFARSLRRTNKVCRRGSPFARSSFSSCGQKSEGEVSYPPGPTEDVLISGLWPLHLDLLQPYFLK